MNATLERVSESLAAVQAEYRRRCAGQRRRHASIRTCRRALLDIADLLALVGLHRPIKSDLVTEILDQLEKVTGPTCERIRRPLRRKWGAK